MVSELLVGFINRALMGLVIIDGFRECEFDFGVRDYRLTVFVHQWVLLSI